MPLHFVDWYNRENKKKVLPLLVCFELHLQINYLCLIASHPKFCWKFQQVTSLLWPPWATSFVTWQEITMTHKAHFLTQTLIQSFILQAIWMLSSGILMIIYLVPIQSLVSTMKHSWMYVILLPTIGLSEYLLSMCFISFFLNFILEMATSESVVQLSL